MNILNEDATTNLCTNPSAETGTANITKVNGTGASSVTPTNEQAWSGNYAFKFEVTSGTTEAYRVGVMPPASMGQTFTSSAWMFIQSGAFRVRVAFRDSGGNVVGGQSGVYTSATAGWVRLSATATAPANTATVEIITGANNPGIAYIDALQLEEKPSATSYADGSLGFGYAWTGTPHSSSSTRAAGVLAADGSITARDINSFGSVTATGSIKPGSFTRSRLPAPGVEGRIINLLDGQRALYRDSGAQWYPLNRGVIDVHDFGARLDARVLLSISATTGSATLTAPAGTFAPTDVGKTILVYGAGASGSNLVTTITAYTNPQTVTVATAAGQGVTGSAIYGTDDTAAFQAAIDATTTPGKRGLFANEVIFTSAAIISDTLLIKDKSMGFAGVGWGALLHDDGTPNSNPGSSLIWAGVVGKPMIHLLDSLNSRLSDFRLFGNSSAKPVGIRAEMSGQANHINAYNTIERIWIGRMFVSSEPDGAARTFSIGIHGTTPAGNTDFYKLNTVRVNGADIGFDSDNANITYWDWQTFIVTDCGTGIIVFGNVHGRNWFFSSNEVDIQIGRTDFPTRGDQGRLNLDHVGSEASRQFIKFVGSGSAVIGGGSYEATARMIAGGVFIEVRGAVGRSLIMRDFRLYAQTYLGPLQDIPVIALGATDPGNIASQHVDIETYNFSEKNILVTPGPNLDGRNELFLRLLQLDSGSDRHINRSEVILTGAESAMPANRHDFAGTVNVIGAPLRARRLKTSGYWYGSFFQRVQAVGTGATQYAYRLAAESDDGVTLASQPIQVANAATLSPTTYNKLGWYKVIGASRYRVYGRTPGNERLLTTLDVGELQRESNDQIWIDDGSITPTDPPPSGDTTGRVIAEGGVVSEDAIVLGNMLLLPYIPTSNPPSGKVYLYVEGGLLKARRDNGAVSTLTP